MALAIAAAVWVLAIPGLARAQSPAPSPGAMPSGTPGLLACVACHGDPGIASSGGSRSELWVQPSTIAGSVHWAFSCVTCHSPLTETVHSKQDAAPSSCVTCHTQEAASGAQGKHGGGAASVLTCVSCHGNHAVVSTASTTFRSQMTTKCRACHAQMNPRFANGNPFGMETHLGRLDVATCWDCHGGHLMLQTQDPRSPVNRANILATCRRCHAGAPSNFADIEIHVASSPVPTDARLRIVTLYMLVLLVGTFAFFGWHTILQIRHERQKARGPEPVGGSS